MQEIEKYSITKEQAFEWLRVKCEEIDTVPLFMSIIDPDCIINKIPAGANGSCRRTIHENMFSMLYPGLLTQVSFGTKKHGMDNYGSRRFIVDFYDPDEKMAYEIDGKSHKRLKYRLSDVQKSICLLELYGIQTVRFTNDQVEAMLKKRLKELEEKGMFVKSGKEAA
jgi:very-short-patch-repair endonuclease